MNRFKVVVRSIETNNVEREYKVNSKYAQKKLKRSVMEKLDHAKFYVVTTNV